MRGVFTRDERVVIVFLAASLAIGSLVLLARRVEPGLEPESPDPRLVAQDQAGGAEELRGPIDVNAATADQLTALPGIGPVRATAIVRLREDRGAFGSLEELLDVKGIGPVTLERLRPLAVAGDQQSDLDAESASSPDSAACGSEAAE